MLVEFEEDLRSAAAGMPGWRAPQVEAPWSACRDALEVPLALAERIRLESPDPGGFEGLIGLIGDLLRPLEVCEAAADAFRTSGGRDDPAGCRIGNTSRIAHRVGERD